jgi:hypothetical protein
MPTSNSPSDCRIPAIRLIGGEIGPIIARVCMLAISLQALLAVPRAVAESPAPPKALMMADIYTLDSATEEGFWLGAIQPPILSDDGKATFLGEPYNQHIGSGTFPRLFVSGGPGVVSDLAKTQAPAPGSGSATFHSFVSPHARGDASAFIGVLKGPDVADTNSQGIWLASATQPPQVLMRSGVPTEGLEDGVMFPPLLLIEPYTVISDDLSDGPRFRFNRAGQAAFLSSLVGPGVVDSSDQGIFVAAGSGLSIVARNGDAAPGYAPSVTFANFAHPSINDRGAVAFLGFVRGAPNGVGIWVGSGEHGLDAVVKFGDPVTSLGAGNWFSGLGTPRINNAGQVAFVGHLNATPQSAVVAGSAGALKVIAKDGDQAPGAGPGVFFDQLGLIGFESYQPIINGSGMVAFASRLAGPAVHEDNDSGLFAQDNQGILRLVAREGDDAPDGGAFTDFGYKATVSMNFNASNQLAFRAVLERTEPGTWAVEGIWALDRSGSLQTIVRTDKLFEFQGPTGSELAEIDTLAFQENSGGEDGWNTNFNDAGQILFWASRPNYRYSVFRSDAVAIPEPRSLVMLAFFGAMAAQRSRRREVAPPSTG